MWVLLLLSATFASFLSVVSGCNLPPSLWCSSYEVAKRCQVLEQCTAFHSRAAAQPVAFTLYYESLCPDCQQFFQLQLYPAWKLVGPIMDLELVPYGNAREHQDGDHWEFDCQHGVDECTGNLIETCAIHKLQNMTVIMPYLACMEASESKPDQSGKQCAEQLGIDYAPILTCANGAEGNSLEHEMATKTEQLNPPHEYVPWVTLNGVHTEDIQKAAQDDLLKLICDTYQGPKPDACSTSIQACHRIPG